MIKQLTTTDPLAQQCRLCWEQLEWRAWPGTRSDQIIKIMAQAWAPIAQRATETALGVTVDPQY